MQFSIFCKQQNKVLRLLLSFIALYFNSAFAMEQAISEVRVNDYNNIRYADVNFLGLADYNHSLSKEIMQRFERHNIASARIYVVYKTDKKQEPFETVYRDFTYSLEGEQRFSIKPLKQAKLSNLTYQQFIENANKVLTNKTFMEVFNPIVIFYQSGWNLEDDGFYWKNHINSKEKFIDRYITFQHIYGNNYTKFEQDLQSRGITGEIKAVDHYHSEQLFISHVLSDKEKGFGKLSSEHIAHVLINIVSKNPACESCFNSLKNIITNNDLKGKFLSQLFNGNVNILKNIPVSILYTAVTDYPSIKGKYLWRHNERLQAVNNIQTRLNLNNKSYFIQMGAFKEGGSTENGPLPYQDNSIYFSCSQNKFVKGMPSKEDKHPGYRTQAEIVEPEQFNQIAKIQKTQQFPKNEEEKASQGPSTQEALKEITKLGEKESEQIKKK